MLLDEAFLQRREYATTELYLTRQSRDGQWVDEMMMRAIGACVRLAVWLSGNTLASINVVALRQTRLVLGWVTVCGRVNHLGM